MNRLLGLTALVGLLASLVVHAYALAGIDIPARFPALWMLHVGALVLCIPLVMSNRRKGGVKSSMAAMRAAFPQWVVVVGGILAAYALLNFVLFMFATQGGSPAEKGGAFILQSHGHFMRELSPSEYWAYRANEVRGFSGHWLMFYFMSLAYFTFRKPSVV